MFLAPVETVPLITGCYCYLCRGAYLYSDGWYPLYANFIWPRTNERI